MPQWEPSVAYYYDDGHLSHTQSDVFLKLGDPTRSISAGDHSLQLHDPAYVRDIARTGPISATPTSHSKIPTAPPTTSPRPSPPHEAIAPLG